MKRAERRQEEVTDQTIAQTPVSMQYIVHNRADSGQKINIVRVY